TLLLDRRVAEGLWPLLAEKVCDAIARDAKKPAGHVLNRHQQAIGFYQLVEDLLHDVLSVGGIGHTPADEIAQPGSLLRDDLGDSTVLLSHRDDARQLIHPLLWTNGGREYCRDGIGEIGVGAIASPGLGAPG